MKVDIGCVAEVAWMPRLYDTRLRDRFDDGEPVSLETVEEVVEDYCGEADVTDEQRRLAGEFYAGCNRLRQRHGWDQSSAATLVYGAGQ